MTNPYPAQFDRALDDLPAEARALDCGSGPRRHTDRRVLSCDSTPGPDVDVVADAAALPFDDASFDLVLSQAVLEHVETPEVVVAEMVRVLRPGGLLCVEVPFMQPYHPVPIHRRNFTAEGLGALCAGLVEVERWVFGGLAVSLEWLGREAGAPEVLGSKWQRILADLQMVDANMTPAQLERVAYAVGGLWAKP